MHDSPPPAVATPPGRQPHSPVPAPSPDHAHGVQIPPRCESGAVLILDACRWVHLADRTPCAPGRRHPRASRRSTWCARRLLIITDV